MAEPTEEIIASYQEKIKKQQEMNAYYSSLVSLPAVTTDGVRVELMANIGLPADVKAAIPYGCEGVGLFRSEFVFMGRQDVPTEDDQFESYKEAVQSCNG